MGLILRHPHPLTQGNLGKAATLSILGRTDNGIEAIVRPTSRAGDPESLHRQSSADSRADSGARAGRLPQQI